MRVVGRSPAVSFRLTLTAMLAAVVACGGCGGGKTVVKGQVQLQGKSITIPTKDMLQLFLYPADKAEKTVEAYMAAVSPDGSFTVKDREGGGIPPGKYKVVATWKSPYPTGPDKLNGRYTLDKSTLIIEAGSEPVTINLEER